MDDLYGHACPECGGLYNAVDYPVTFDPEALAKGLREIYDGLDVKNVIERFIFEETLRLFNEAAAKGAAASEYPTVATDEFIRQIRTNNAVFSAFRVHRMQNDVARQLIDEDGKLKSFDKWMRDIKGITNHYVRNWLQSEYSTAVIRAHQAVDWKHFETEADVLPNLRWMPTTSPNQDPLHRQYWEKKLTLPVGHPFWDEHHPGDRWNCKCTLMQTDEPANDELVRDLYPVPAQPGLENNPAKDGKIFSDTHPYITQAYPGAEKAVKTAVKEQQKNSDYILNGYKQVKVLDGQNQKLTEKVIQTENELRKNKGHETAVVFNKDGDILVDKRGKATSVAFTETEVRKMKDAILTHNHPRGWGYDKNEWGRIGNSFSMDDLKLAINADVAEIRAVTPNYTFSMLRPEKGWRISLDDLNKKYKKINDQIYKDNTAAINLGNVTPEQANAVHFHMLNRALAKEFGWIYTKRRTI